MIPGSQEACVSWLRSCSVVVQALCGTVSMCHSSVPRLAVYPWFCAVAELCGHHRAWNESGLVSLSSGQCLMALLLGLPKHQGTCQATACCCCSQRPSQPGRNSRGGCVAAGSATGGTESLWSEERAMGQMVRLPHLPPAQLHPCPPRCLI